MIKKVVCRFISILFSFSLAAFCEEYPIIVSGPIEMYPGQCYDFQVNSRAETSLLDTVSWKVYAIDSHESHLLSSDDDGNTVFRSCSTSIPGFTAKAQRLFWCTGIATQKSISGFLNPSSTLSAVYLSHFKSSDSTGGYDPLIITYFKSYPTLVNGQEAVLTAAFENGERMVGDSTKPLSWKWSLGCLSTDGLKMTMESDTIFGGDQSEWRLTPKLDTNLIYPRDSLGRILVFLGVRVMYSDSTMHGIETTLRMDPGTTRIENNIFSHQVNSGSYLTVFINNNGNVRLLFPSVQEQGTSLTVFDSRGKLLKRWSGSQLAGKQEITFANSEGAGLRVARLRTSKGQNQTVRWVSP